MPRTSASPFSFGHIAAAAVSSGTTHRAAFLQWLATILGSAAACNIALGIPWFRTPRAKLILCIMVLTVLCYTTDPREFEQWSLGTIFLPGFMASLHCSALEDCPPPGA